MRGLIILLCLLPGYVFSQNVDIRVLRVLNSPEPLASDNFFRFISDSHGFITAAVPLTIGITGFIKRDDVMKKKALVISGSVLLEIGIAQTLKYTIRRERPFVTYPDITKKISAGDPSFPSGHTATAFATATALSLSYPEWYVVVPSYLWAGAVGYSRLHLGVHYPSDVLAGAVVGSGSAWLTHYINKKLIRGHKKTGK
jgi:membrane-associated phospholipid phosphatase